MVWLHFLTKMRPLNRFFYRGPCFSLFYIGLISVFVSVFSICRADPHKNDDTHLTAPLTPLDFLYERVIAVPNNTFLQQLLRFACTQALFLFATTHQLAESNNLSPEKRKQLIQAKAVFTRAIQPFLVAFPVLNAMAGTTDLFQALDTERREHQILRS